MLYGTSLDDQRYTETIRACGLLEDLDQLPDGDQTIIGGAQPPYADRAAIALRVTESSASQIVSIAILVPRTTYIAVCVDMIDTGINISGRQKGESTFQVARSRGLHLLGHFIGKPIFTCSTMC
eukprot:COSAG02_NODE_15190_length_1195_cov_1.475365_1_plen_124_part_00